MERQKPRPFEVVVEEVIVEAPDAATLVLSAGATQVEYKAGQFLTIDPRQFAAVRSHLSFLEALKGKKELPRAYSMSSAPDEPKLCITIKEEAYFAAAAKHAPLLSPLLTYATAVGTKMTVTGFTGPYILPPDIEERTDHVVHVVAGSGAVPNFSIVKDSLRRHPKLRHTFLSSNKTWGDALFRERLAELEKTYAGRLKVVHTLTRQDDLQGTQGDVRKGRISEALLGELVPDGGTAIAFVCGPAIPPWERRAALDTKVSPAPRFLESTLAALERLGLSRDRIKREAYG